MLRSSDSNLGASQAPSDAIVPSAAGKSPGASVPTPTAVASPSSLPSSSEAKQISVLFPREKDKRKLTLFRDKTGGKNNGKLDGFYRDEAKNEYFIKVPDDKSELFTELLAGKVLTKMKAAGLIPEKYHHLLICADYVTFDDGTYGLIQPCINFKEVWTLFEKKSSSDPSFLSRMMNFFFSKRKDRNPIDEMAFGQTYYYPLLAELKANDSLAACLLFSLIIGDYSVHSGNMVYFETEIKDHNGEEKDFFDDEEDFAEFIERIKLYKYEAGRADFGAAWRHYGDKRNRDVMNPLEYHGLKGYTKGYHLFYTKVPGLFKAICSQAGDLLNLLRQNSTLLNQLISEAVNEIPDNLLSSAERIETAKYLGFETFKSASNAKEFSQEMAEIMMQRIVNISKLPQISPDLIIPAEAKATKAADPKKLTPSDMFDFALLKIQKIVNKSADSKEVEAFKIIEPTTDSSVYGARFSVNGQNIVLMSPSSDNPTQEIGKNVGTIDLSMVLERIRSIQSHNPLDTFLIPLAECQTTMLIPRQHWTMLMIQGNNCAFFDPCSDSLWSMSLSSVYSLNSLKKILIAKEFTLHDQNVVYLGWQTDNINCGRFSAAIAEHAASALFVGDDLRVVQVKLIGEAKPQISTLVTEFLTCKRHDLIAQNQAICELRGQGFIPLAIPQDPLVTHRKEDSQSAMLHRLTTGEYKQITTVKPEVALPTLAISDNITLTQTLSTQVIPVIPQQVEDTKKMESHTFENISVTEEPTPVASMPPMPQQKDNKIEVEPEIKLPTPVTVSNDITPPTQAFQTPVGVVQINDTKRMDSHTNINIVVIEEKHPVTQPLPITPITSIPSPMPQQIANLNRPPDFVQLDEAKTTPRWKYVLAGIGILLGLAALASGIGALGGLGLLAAIGTELAGCLIGGGALSIMSSVRYTQSTSAKNGMFSKSYQNATRAATSTPILDVLSNELPLTFCK